MTSLAQTKAASQALDSQIEQEIESSDPSDLLAVFQDLEKVIDKRRGEEIDVSYTARLHQAGLTKMLDKLGEELAELMVASCLDDDKTIVNEAADACYHLLVLASYLSITTEDLDIANQIESPPKTTEENTKASSEKNAEADLLIAASTSWAKLLWAITKTKDKANDVNTEGSSIGWGNNQVLSALQQLLAKIILIFASNKISFSKLTDELRSRMQRKA